MYIKIDKYDIEVVVEYKNNKNLYMRINDDLKLYVSCNKFVSNNEIKKIIEKNEKGLLKMYERKLKEIDNNSFNYYLGDKYTVVYDESLKKYCIDGDTIFVKDDKMLEKFYGDACIKIFNERLSKWIPLFPYVPKFSLKIRKMKTRWGVCNRGNNTVTLNSELIKKDVNLIDYVIVHELSHFKEANHSDKFWDEVKKRYPYYKEARKILNDV